MFIFGFLTIFFFTIPCIKVYYMPLHANFRNRDKNFFLSALQKNDPVQNYNIRHWVYQLHLQQCAFVEIGEAFCALFVELQTIPRETAETQIAEFFLGICDCNTLRSWKLCSPDLFAMRESDCIFTEATATANTSARVHRRLCDLTFLSSIAPFCNCSIPLAGQQLYRTEGSSFPTCFLNPLPKSICSPRGVCGVAGCTVKTIKGIHLTQCDPNCHQKQPFCEELGPWTSVPPRITSLWSKWSIPKCNATYGRGLLVSTSFCDNQVTGRKAIDCIGPGSLCCSHASEMCECKVTIENGIMKARRFTEPCTTSASYPAIIKERSLLPKSQFEESTNYGVDDEYEEFEPEILEETSNDYVERNSLSLRRLLQNLDYDINDYDIMSTNDDDKEFKANENNERMVAIDEDVDDNDIEYDPDMENPDDVVEDEDDEEEEKDEEGEDDDMMAFRKARGRSNHINHDRVIRSDDKATFKRQSRFLGFPFWRKKLPKENLNCEDPSVTELPIYRDYDPANSSEVSIKPQISLLVLMYFIASFTKFSLK